MEDLCTEHLAEVIKLLEPKHIVGIGRYAQQKCSKITKKYGVDSQIHYLIHPSPRVFSNSAKWIENAEEFFRTNGLINILNADALL